VACSATFHYAPMRPKSSLVAVAHRAVTVLLVASRERISKFAYFYRPPSCPATLSIGTGDPVYYTELLKEIPSLVYRRLPSDERSSQGIDDTLARCLQTLLDDIAGISLCEKGNYLRYNGLLEE
jgi:hypothetical protein